MKKRLFSLLIAAMLLAGTGAATVSYTLSPAEYPIVVNGTAMEFDGAVPMNWEGSTMLPLRAIAEALGVDIQWNEEKRQVEINTIDLEALKDSCVMVYAGSNGKYGTYDRQGSGVLIDYDEILTCWHVVEDKSHYIVKYDDSDADIWVELSDSAEKKDAAVLTPPDRSVKPVKIGDSDEVEVGDTVYIISSPHGEKNVITVGKVLKFTKTKGIAVFATSTAIENGGSGGAVFNAKGELIGIAESISKDKTKNYIIPINDIREDLAA